MQQLKRAHVLLLKVAATKAWCSQINKYCFKKKQLSNEQLYVCVCVREREGVKKNNNKQ